MSPKMSRKCDISVIYWTHRLNFHNCQMDILNTANIFNFSKLYKGATARVWEGVSGGRGDKYADVLRVKGFRGDEVSKTRSN